MQFSNFSRLQEGLTIILYNDVPIENVGTIKYYTDNASGSFSKKEFCWSFNNEYWAAWQTLNQSNISFVDTYSNYYFFLKVRYTLNTLSSGTVTTFALNYLKGNATPYTPRIYNQDIVNQDASAILIHDILQSYEVTPISDASLLNGYPGSWYRNRANQYGYQPISSITGLQNALNNAGVSGVYLKEASIGMGFNWDSSGYLNVGFDVLDGGSNWGIILSNVISGGSW